MHDLPTTVALLKQQMVDTEKRIMDKLTAQERRTARIEMAILTCLGTIIYAVFSVLLKKAGF